MAKSKGGKGKSAKKAAPGKACGKKEESSFLPPREEMCPAVRRHNEGAVPDDSDDTIVLLLFGEGPAEVGHWEVSTKNLKPGQPRWKHSVRGALPVLLDKCLKGHTGGKRVIYETVDQEELRAFRMTQMGKKDNAVPRKVRMMAGDFHRHYVAFHKDSDDLGLHDGYKKAKEPLEKCEADGLTCLPIAPVHMTEAWLLSDPLAFERAFGKPKRNPKIPENPETCWNEREANPNHPHQIMGRVLSAYGQDRSAEAYTKVAKAISIDKVSAKSKSFTRFATEAATFLN